MDFFVYLRWLFDVSVQFDIAHPALSRLVNRATYGDVPFREEMLQRSQLVSLDYLSELAKQGIEQGDINPDVAPDLAVFVVTTLSNGLRYFIPQRLDLNERKLAQEVPGNLDMVAVDKIFNDLIRVIEHGIGKPSHMC